MDAVLYSKRVHTLDGVSLTIAAINGNIVEISIIPYTLENTTLGIKVKSDTLNVETDIIGKYIDRLLTFDGEDTEIEHKYFKNYSAYPIW